MNRLLAGLRPLPIALVIGIIAASYTFFEHERPELFSDRFLHRLELKTLDSKFILRGQKEIEPVVVIAAGDEKTIKKFGRWGTWDRGAIAQVIQNLFAAKADVVALDMVFADEAGFDFKGAARMREALETQNEDPSQKLESVQRAFDQSSQGDQELHDVFENYTNNVVQGFIALALPEPGAAPSRPEESEESMEPFVLDGYGVRLKVSESAEREAAGGERISVQAERLPDQKPSDLKDVPEIQGTITLPLENYMDAASYLGFFSTVADVDGVLRRLPLVYRHGETFFPSLGLMAAAGHFGASPELIQHKSHTTSLQSVVFIGEKGSYHEIPVMRDGSLLINYLGSSKPRAAGGTFEHVSMADIYDDTFDKTKVAGKIIFLAVTAIGTFDQRVTPFSSNAPGVEVHAAAVQSIVGGNPLKRRSMHAQMETVLSLFLALLMGIALRRLPMAYGTLVVLLIALGWYLFDVFVAFNQFNIWLHQWVIYLQLLATWIAITFWGYLAEGREKALLKKEFSTVLAPAVVDELLKNPRLAGLGGAEKELTVMFSDIRGFTSISEKMSPDGLTQFLNEYLTPMTEILMQRQGTLDKYMGDAIMAFWGAPVDQPDHAVRACLAALDMLEELERLRTRWREAGKPVIDVGIGLNTGLMRVGFMGSERMRNYTLLGDNVNLGSRLEGVNKQYGTNIIIGSQTKDVIGDSMYTRELDAIRVKGKNEPVTIYELRGKGTPPEDEALFLADFAEGLALYMGKEFSQARTLFERCLEHSPHDVPTQLYITRCLAFEESPPSEDWDGVFDMKTK